MSKLIGGVLKRPTRVIAPIAGKTARAKTGDTPVRTEPAQS